MKNCNAFGKVLRMIRIESGDIMIDMAGKLHVSPAYLSAIESGDRTIPQDFIQRIIDVYHPNTNWIDQLVLAKCEVDNEVKVVLGGDTTQSIRELCALFARKVNTLTPEQASEMTSLLLSYENK